MEEEIEDIVGDVKLTDSQKSVTTSNVYSMDFTDCSSDRNNSSGKDTYVIEHYDSEDSDLYPVHEDKTVIDLKGNKNNKDAYIQCEVTNKVTRTTATNVHTCIVAQEIFTQTSKTIFELAQTEGVNKETLETQTSFISFTENRTFEYRIEMSNDKNNKSKAHTIDDYDRVLTDTLENESSKFPVSESETARSEENKSEASSEDRIINILDTESIENVPSDENQETQYENTSDFNESNNSDIEQDSLMDPTNDVEIEDCGDEINDIRKSVDCEIEDLYKKLAGNFELSPGEKIENGKRYSTLTPLTEESTIRRDSLLNLTINDIDDMDKPLDDCEKNVYTPFFGGKVKMLHEEDEEREEVRLPPIQNRSCPNSPHLNFLFTVHPSNKLKKSGTLPCVYEATEKGLDKWDVDTKNLACGECPLNNGRSDPVPTNGSIHLPPIHIEGYVVNSQINRNEPQINNRQHPEIHHDSISIKERIRDLKMTKGAKSRTPSKYNMISDSRSGSPNCDESPDETRLCDTVERGCEVLCAEMLRRLKSNSWLEVVETLEDMPKALEKFWGIIAENRIADLIRQVSAQIDSPRTQVSRIACNTLAVILKNTNYTKKPDFHEAMTLLLTKTGSFSRPVRRAANVALDSVVCGVELSHSVTALSIHGVDHKSPLVRSAAARLLVVSCALGGGGRALLRARPPTAASARRHTLRALAALLDDKNTDARKYAERLYTMLRPLSNFEAYYLTDVDVELATRQMKKYDRLLLCAPAKDAR